MRLKEWLENPKKGPAYLAGNEIIDAQPAGRDKWGAFYRVTVRAREGGRLVQMDHISPLIHVSDKPISGPDLGPGETD